MTRLLTFVFASFSAVAFAACGGGTGTTATPPISTGGETATSTLDQKRRTRAADDTRRLNRDDGPKHEGQKISKNIRQRQHRQRLTRSPCSNIHRQRLADDAELTYSPAFFPGALAVDAAGRIYVANFGEGESVPGEILLFASSGTLLRSGFNCAFPVGVAVDRYSDAYASCVYTIPTGSFFGAVYRYTASGTNDLTITGIHPGAIAVNADDSAAILSLRHHGGTPKHCRSSPKGQSRGRTVP